MKPNKILLWISISEINLQLSLSVFQTDSNFNSAEKNDVSEILGYKISGIGELSRIIEIRFNVQNESENAVEQFSKLLVSLNAHRKGDKKYSGYFLYTKADQRYQIYSNQLTLYLDVPELTFNKFCNEISSQNINNLIIGISLDGEEDSDVGSFGPPCHDDLVRITANDFMFNSNVKLTSIDANIHVSKYRRTDLNDEN
jgi:hypothetical protein